MILPPEWQQRLVSWWGSEWWDDEEKKTLKFKQYQDKSPVLCWDILTVENGIFPWDIVFFEWENEKNALRYTWYVALQIPKLNKTIFINDMKWEATFVCDQLVSQEDMKKSKKRLSKQLWEAFHSVNYLEDKKELWKLDMLDLIFWPEKWSRKIVREALMDEKWELTEKWKEWFNSIYTSRKNFNISWVSYIVIARKFWFTEEIADLYKEQVFWDLSKEMFWEWKAEEVRQQLISEEQEKIKEEQQKIRKELINEKWELTEKWKEWFSYIVWTRRQFHLSNKMWYVAIAWKFWIKREKPGDLFKEDAFIDLSKAIFGENNKNVKNLMLETIQNDIRAELINEKWELTEKWKEWFNLDSQNKRSDFNLSNKMSYTDIARKFWFTEEIVDLSKDNIFWKLSEKIFGKENENVKNLNNILYYKNLSAEGVREVLLQNPHIRFVLNTSKSRREFNLFGWMSYITIARKFWFTEEIVDLYKDNVFWDLSKKIFWKEKTEEIKQQLISEEQKNIRLALEDENWLTEKWRQWFESDTTNRDSFNIWDGELWYVAIAWKFWIKVEKNGDLIKDRVFNKLTEKIFWKKKKEEYEEQLIKEEQQKIRLALEDENWLTEKWRQWLESDTTNRKLLSIWTKTCTEIWKIFWLQINRDVLLKNENFWKLTEIIFWKEKKEKYEQQLISEEQQKIRKELINEKWELTEKWKEWIHLMHTSRKNFNISWVSYIVIARKFWFTEDSADLYKDNVFWDLSKKIFWEEKTEQYKQQLISEKQEKIKEEQQKIRKELINEKWELTEKWKEWFSYIVWTRKNFHLSDNMWYVAIAWKFWIKRETPGDLFKEDAFKDLSKAIFGKDDEEIKQLQRKFRKKKK
jgi:hypothetical protein